MKKHISIGQVVIVTVISLGFLYSSGFFMPEERTYSQTESYVVGATPPTVVTWEMY